MTNAELLKETERLLAMKQLDWMHACKEIDRLEDRVKKLTKGLASLCECNKQVPPCPACKALVDK